MVDERVMNGGDYRTLEISENEEIKGSKWAQKIAVLEQEKSKLIRDNGSVRESVSNLEGELRILESETAKLRREIVMSDAEKKSLEAEVSRLQYVVITSEADGADEHKEARELKWELEKLKESDFEKGRKFDVADKERALLSEKLGNVEIELRVLMEQMLELKNLFEGFVEGESGKKAKIMEKDCEIVELKKRVEALEGEKRDLKRLFELSEKKVRELLREKSVDEINGIHVLRCEDEGLFGVKLMWPVLAASVGVVAVGAACYLRARQR